MNIWTAFWGGHHQQLPGEAGRGAGSDAQTDFGACGLAGPGRVVPSDPIEGHDCLPRWTNGADRRDFSATPYWGVKKVLRLVSMVKTTTAAGMPGALPRPGLQISPT